MKNRRWVLLLLLLQGGIACAGDRIQLYPAFVSGGIGAIEGRVIAYEEATPYSLSEGRRANLRRSLGALVNDERANVPVTVRLVERQWPATTDVEGYYWSAGISAGVLNRWAPDGRLDRQIPVPCAAPTMPCFGGPEMRTIFLTSLRHNLAPEKLAASPLSGALFALDVDVPGVPVAKFNG